MKLFCWWLVVACGIALANERPVLKVGSKMFTESVILAELAEQLAQVEYVDTEHKAQLGGTQVLWKALQRGDIDLYPDYTGTVTRELIAQPMLNTIPEIRAALEKMGIGMTDPLGFNNTYAIGMKKDLAEQKGIRNLSNLREHPDLKFGLSHEFLDRADGWPALKSRYKLNPAEVRGLDHDLAYRAIGTGEIQATDLYSTDAEIRYYDLEVLDDDLELFPKYQAVFLYRLDLKERMPGVLKSIERLAGRIPRAKMVEMNSSAKIDKEKESQIAAKFLREEFKLTVDFRRVFFSQQIWEYTRQHLYLVGVSLFFTILIGVPLGIYAARNPRVGQIVLGLAGIIQTIPALALLVFMIPLLGIGSRPALTALFLYGLLPIVRNTYVGIKDIAPSLLEAADALGLPRRARLFRIELPMASRAILAGIKTSAVINIGTATLGALIGAGGYGEPILTGIRRDEIGTILEGAIPAAILALIVQALFEWAERHLIPKGLRQPTHQASPASDR